MTDAADDKEEELAQRLVDVIADHQRRQDELAGDALQWSAPYLRALIELAALHPEEFRDLCPKPTAGVDAAPMTPEVVAP